MSENLISEYYRGMPCMLGEVVGRIVGESEEGSWGEIGGVMMNSVPLFATPHGTIIKTGIMRLSKITDEGMQKLIEYEKQLTENSIYLCPSCGEMRDVEEMCNKDGACDHCNSEHCPECNSGAVGFDNGEYECFDCGHRW